MGFKHSNLAYSFGILKNILMLFVRNIFGILNMILLVEWNNLRTSVQSLEKLCHYIKGIWRLPNFFLNFRDSLFHLFHLSHPFSWNPNQCWCCACFAHSPIFPCCWPILKLSYSLIASPILPSSLLYSDTPSLLHSSRLFATSLPVVIMALCYRTARGHLLCPLLFSYLK